MINGRGSGLRELALKATLDVLIPKLTEDLQIALLPKDEADAKNAILEVRAGTGGDEAALFSSRPDVSAVCVAAGLEVRGAGGEQLDTRWL